VESNYRIKYHAKYLKWYSGLKDDRALARISARVEQIREFGNFGDRKFVGGGVWELRIDYGPGYRIYYTQSGNKVVLLLCGGDKSNQADDIKSAVKLAKEAENVR
jgi:putative addiction module killer protein